MPPLDDELENNNEDMLLSSHVDEDDAPLATLARASEEDSYEELVRKEYEANINDGSLHLSDEEAEY